MSNEEQHTKIISQHEEIIRKKTEMLQVLYDLKLLTEMNSRLVLSALESTRATVNNAVKAPFAIILAALATWMFFVDKIDQAHWFYCLCVSAFPWFGEPIRLILNRVGGGEKSVTALK